MTTEVSSAEGILQETGLRHVAVIMDGNRRWAQEKHLPGLMGHKQGVEALRTLVAHCGTIGLEALTVYAFSTENWRRSEEEVGYLMQLFVEALGREVRELHANNVRLRFIGDLDGLPPALRARMEESVALTVENTGLRLQVAFNYGSRAELVQAMQAMARLVAAGHLQPEDITEERFESFLYTADLPVPDMLIRTGGEQRLSNYLLWQCAYAELYVTPVFWPEFSPAEFDRALAEYQRRNRRFGR